MGRGKKGKKGKKSNTGNLENPSTEDRREETEDNGEGTKDSGREGTENNGEGTGGNGEGTENNGEGTGGNGEGIENNGEGTGESGEGIENNGEGTGESVEGIENNREGTGESGEGIENNGEGTGESGEGIENNGEGTGESGEGIENNGEGTGESGEGIENNREGTENGRKVKGDSGEGTENNGEGTGDSGEGTENNREGTGGIGEGTVINGEGTRENGDGTEDNGEGTEDGRKVIENSGEKTEEGKVETENSEEEEDKEPNQDTNNQGTERGEAKGAQTEGKEKDEQGTEGEALIDETNHGVLQQRQPKDAGGAARAEELRQRAAPAEEGRRQLTERRVADLEVELEDTRKRLKEKERRHENEKRDLEMKISSLHEKILHSEKEKRDSDQRLLTQLTQKKEEIEKSRKKTSDLEKTQARLETELNQRNKEIETSRKKISALEKKLFEAEDDLRAVQASLRSEEASHHRTQEDLARRTQMASQANKDKVDWQLRLAEWRERTRVEQDSREKEGAQNAERITSLEREKEERNQRISALEECKRETEEELKRMANDWRKEREENTKEIKEWKQHVKNIEEELEKAKDNQQKGKHESQMEVVQWKQHSLLMAIRYGDSDGVTKILQKGTSPNFRDREGWTPLHIAATNDHVEIACKLLDAGAKTEKINRYGDKPLHTATRAGSKGVVKTLLDRGASLDAEDSRGKTAAEVAASLGKTDVLQRLYQPESSAPLPHIAAANGHESTSKWLVNAGFPRGARWEHCLAYKYAQAAGFFTVAARLALARKGFAGKLINFFFGWRPLVWVIFFLFFRGEKNPSKESVENMQEKEGEGPLIPIEELDDPTLLQDSHSPRKKMDTEFDSSTAGYEIINEVYDDPSQPKDSGATRGGTQQKRKEISFKATSVSTFLPNQEKGLEPVRPWAPPGLPNIGNTCYMNSVLQCLYHTLPVTNFFLINDIRKHINAKSEQRGKVALAYGALVRAMAEGGDLLLAVRDMKRVSGEFDQYFNDDGQKEPHDLLGAALGWLHNDLARKSPDAVTSFISDEHDMSSIISDTFHIQHLSTIVCEKSDKPIIMKIVSLSSLTLAMNSSESVDLEELLKKYYAPQYVNWDCYICGRSHACRQENRILHLPPFLIIHFSRYNAKNLYAPKVGVKFPKTLKCMNNFCGYKSERKYSLYGVCAHQGTMKFGHCISVCKPTTQGQAKEGSKGMWHLCNDEMVLPKADHSAISNEDAHILFYEAL